MENTNSINKHILSISKLRKLLSKLPDPESTTVQSHSIALDDDSSRNVVFDKIIMKKADGSKTQRWTYKGRVYIDSKYYKNDI